MTADIQAIQQGLADAAASITGLRCFPSLPDAINPPTFAPVSLTIDYNQTFSDLMAIQLECGLYVSTGDTLTGRKALAGYLAPAGTGSLPAALETDRTLSGACRTMDVVRVRGAYSLYSIGGAEYLGAVFEVSVWA